MENQGLRINKAIAGAGVCSRRHADDLIRQGRVRVNGQPVLEPGLLLKAGDRLEIDGKLVSFSAPEQGAVKTGANAGAGSHIYLMLNKPTQVVSTARDPDGRPTVLDFLPEAQRGRRLFPVGRLDYFSEGLILLTDDGALTQRLTHPRHHLPKYYEVLLRGQVPESALEAMRQGMTLAEGERLAPVQAERLNPEERGKSARPERSAQPGLSDVAPDRIGQADKNETLRLTLHQGVNRQIRRMCRDLGLTILRLRRVGQGPLRLGELPSGKCRPLNEGELTALFKAVGL
ncbi:MAG: rRNA pseudouridine synthase [Deltaproteobacteria bacterium]|nr:rRNA pseudouridine synthase [Deltaproteobacteria bacterium]